MSLKLKPNEVCKYSSNCPYNQGCKGIDSLRSNWFVCDLVTEFGVFLEGKFRSRFDETGKMKIILE